MAYFPVSLYLATYAVSLLSVDDTFTTNLVVGVFNLAAMLGSNLTGWGADKSLPWTVSFIGAAGGVVAVSAWGSADSLGKVFGFAVLFGASSQICSTWGPAGAIVAGELSHILRGVHSDESQSRKTDISELQVQTLKLRRQSSVSGELCVV